MPKYYRSDTKTPVIYRAHLEFQHSDRDGKFPCYWALYDEEEQRWIPWRRLAANLHRVVIESLGEEISEEEVAMTLMENSYD